MSLCMLENISPRRAESFGMKAPAALYRRFWSMEVKANEYLPCCVLVAPVEILRVGSGWKLAISPGIIEIWALRSSETSAMGLRSSRGLRVMKPNPMFWLMKLDTPETRTKFLMSGVR